MLKFFISFHIVICILLVLFVLIQPGGRNNSSATFGGSAIDSAFGGRGINTALSKVTFITGFLFMFTSLFLSIASISNNSSS